MTENFHKFEDILSFQTNLTRTVGEVWGHIFTWTLITSVIAHAVAAGLALYQLSQIKFGKFIAATILIMGVISPLLCNSITCAVIAAVISAAGLLPFSPFLTLLIGTFLTTMLIVIATTRLPATL